MMDQLLGEISLQAFLSRQILFPDHLLTFFAGFPGFLRDFVPAQMEILTREQFTDFIQKVIQEGIDSRISGAEDPSLIHKSITEPGFFSTAGKLWIGGDNGRGVSGQIDLRDDFDSPLFRKSHHFADLILCIIASGGSVRSLAGCQHGSDLVQLGKTFAFDSESLIVGQMPVEFVQL